MQRSAPRLLRALQQTGETAVFRRGSGARQCSGLGAAGIIVPCEARPSGVMRRHTEPALASAVRHDDHLVCVCNDACASFSGAQSCRMVPGLAINRLRPWQHYAGAAAEAASVSAAAPALTRQFGAPAGGHHDSPTTPLSGIMPTVVSLPRKVRTSCLGLESGLQGLFPRQQQGAALRF